MALTLYEVTVPVFLRGFETMSACLEKGRDYALAEGIDAGEMLGTRLAPDMLTLTGQVQRASDTAKFAAVRIGGVENESFADDEKSFEDLEDRIARTRAFLAAVPRAAIDANEDATISANIGRAKVTMPARDYALRFAVPNFYFHVVTAYGLLRHRGVPLGKTDYIGSLG